jgi:hypothetical protein
MTDRTRRPCRPRGLAEGLVALLAVAGVLTCPSKGSAQNSTGGVSPGGLPPIPPATVKPADPGSNAPEPGRVPAPPVVQSGPAPTTPPPAITPPPPPPPPPPSFTPPAPTPPAPRFQFNIDPKAPVKSLLPVAPKATGQTGPLLGDDLTRVPEVSFEAAPAKGLPSIKALEHNAHTLAKVNHLNAKKRDGFMETLLGERSDLTGLPFAMGDACRMKGERSREFNVALVIVRASLNAAGDGFWDHFQTQCAQHDQKSARKDRAHCENVTLARVAALMQVLAPESAARRKGLVKYLAGVSHAEATRALARLALFSAEDEIRTAAVEALKVRRERDYNDILLAGLRYPWPAVARRASDALVKLERNDLVEKLVDLLDEPDPRLPVVKKVRNKSVPVVRELVRINHHRNCVLCHAPGDTGNLSADVGTAPVPTPGESLSPPSGGYGSSSHNVLVRIDVTYLRQDFSVLQPVADAHPWPEMQRFDFLVRTRVLTEEEAKVYRDKLSPREEGRLSPYHRAVLSALRELTGRDTAPNPQAWRKLLGLPARQQETGKGELPGKVISTH